MRRLLVLTVAAALVSAGLAPAHAAGPQRVSFVLKRVWSGRPTSYDLQLGVELDHTYGGFIGDVGGYFSRGRPVSSETSYFGSVRRWENDTVQVGNTTFTTCQAGLLCYGDDDPGMYGLGSTYADNGESHAPNYYFVVATGRHVEYTFHGTGWTLVRTPLTSRYLDGGDTGAAAVHVLQSGVEVYGDGSLPGGRYGSIGAGKPPCSLAASSLVSRGVGSVTLEGGVDRPEFTCPTSRVMLSSYATGPTTWRLRGTAVGDNTMADSRLFVLDLPRRLP